MVVDVRDQGEASGHVRTHGFPHLGPNLLADAVHAGHVDAHLSGAAEDERSKLGRMLEHRIALRLPREELLFEA
jgi:hypothetical protein